MSLSISLFSAGPVDAGREDALIFAKKAWYARELLLAPSFTCRHLPRALATAYAPRCTLMFAIVRVHFLADIIAIYDFPISFTLSFRKEYTTTPAHFSSHAGTPETAYAYLHTPPAYFFHFTFTLNDFHSASAIYIDFYYFRHTLIRWWFPAAYNITTISTYCDIIFFASTGWFTSTTSWKCNANYEYCNFPPFHDE